VGIFVGMNYVENWNPNNDKFRHFYGWNDSLGTWEMEMVPVPGLGTVAVHRFEKENQNEAEGTLFILHGYLEHTALRMPFIMEAVKGGWQVCGMDLPGHGLSEGERANISDFDDYTRAFKAVLESRRWPKPWRILAHSTGCAVAMMYMVTHGNPFEWSIFEAPLVRTFLWKPTMVAKKMFRNALNTLPRRNAGLPKKETFYHLLLQDPLYLNRVPIAWFDALEVYVEKLSLWPQIPGRFLILQGTADTVVDGEYNLNFLRKHLPEAEIVPIKGGRHHLLRDEGPAGTLARQAIRKRF